jgi:hypothetical protein
MFEELLGNDERAEATHFRKVSRVISEGGDERVTIPLLVRGLEQAALRNDGEVITQLLIQAGLLLAAPEQSSVVSAAG